MSEKKIRIVLFALIASIIIITILGITLYFTTDLLKPKEDLFKKYLINDLQKIYNIVDISEEKGIIDNLRKNDYEEKTNATLKYLENENDQEEVYAINENGQINNSDNESFRTLSINSNEDYNLISFEQLKKDETYGIRVSSLVEQFVSVENSSIAYFVSSLGYNGQYFTEKLNTKGVDISDIFNFSKEELNKLVNNYSKAIFSDINSKQYSKESNATITLANKKSIDKTQGYVLELTKNDIDRIYKRILKQAYSDDIIINKLDQIDEKILELGLNEPEGKSLKEQYLSYVKAEYEKIEYQGTDTSKYIIKVYEKKGKTIRILFKSEQKEFDLDLFDDEYNNLALTVKTFTQEGVDTSIYYIAKKKANNSCNRKYGYFDETTNIELKIDSTGKNDGYNISTNLTFKDPKTYKIDLETSTEFVYGKKNIQPFFNQNNNIVLNKYDGEDVENILKNLKGRVIRSLEERKSVINKKLLNNILIWVDNREKKIAEEEKNNAELKRERFNNKFLLYQGTNLKIDHVQKMLEVIGKNFSNVEVLDGKTIRMHIKENSTNKEMINKISETITNKNTYDVSINFSNDGYVESIDVTIYDRNKSK